MFCLAYYPTSGDMKGTRCAVWLDYGVPCIWSTVPAMRTWMQQTRIEKYFDVEVVPVRIAVDLTAEMVEVYSGRRKVQGSLRPVVAPNRATYEHLAKIHRLEISIGNPQPNC